MEQMKLHSMTVRHMRMQMREPFVTSLGTDFDKEFLLITIRDNNGVEGWGECVAELSPFYSEETNETGKHIIRDFLFPMMRPLVIRHPHDTFETFEHVRRHRMAKAGVECALWDLYARRNNQPLWQALGGTRDKIDVGISIGIQDSPEALVGRVERYIKEGYKRMKCKIKPGKDIEYLRAVRKQFPDVPLMADANSAYTLADTALLRQLDEFNLTMVEQPLSHDDIIDHAVLQRELRTPICLDESIHSYEDARKALSINACKIINIKLGRVGGLGESKRIEQLCRENGVPVWCGGMMEAGIGRGFNIAITTLPGFTLPGDTAASSRYWERDIIDPAVTVEDGTITVSSQPGFGYNIDFEYLDHLTLHKETLLF